MSDTKRFVITTIAISLVAVLTGRFMVGALIPSTPSGLRQYNERTTTNQTQIFSVHSDPDLSVHVHKITQRVKITETTPHGYFHDLNSMLASNIAYSPAAATEVIAPNEIWIITREFRPSVMTVPVGTTVTWINKDFEEHTVTFDNIDINRRLEAHDTSFSYTFTEAGTFTYYCDPHPDMKATLIVK